MSVNMENKIYYIAIKNTIDGYRKENSEEGFKLVERELVEVKDTEQYYEDIDYKKIFLRSYYRRFSDTSPSLDFEGKEIFWEKRLVAETLFDNLLKQLDDKTSVRKYMCHGDISDDEYLELLEKHALL